MRVMVFHTSAGGVQDMSEPSPETLAAFKAMDDFTEELVKAGVFVAAAGLKDGADAKRIYFDGEGGRVITDGPFAETRELVVGFSIWQVKDIDEAMAWVKRLPDFPGQKGAVEIRPFYEAEDLGAFVSPEEMAAPRDGERGKLGVA